MLRKQLLASASRSRIVAILRRGSQTADEIAAELGITAAAVRAQLATMERDGIARRTGQRAGTTRPSQMFGLTPDVEQLLSGAYIPMLIELVRQSAARVEAAELDDLMRSTGRGLAAAFPRLSVRDAPLVTRVIAVSVLLNEEFGSTMRVEKADGRYVLRGYACPLAALTGNHPAVCLAIESLIATLLETNVRECCDRTERPQCCFHIGATI